MIAFLNKCSEEESAQMQVALSTNHKCTIELSAQKTVDITADMVQFEKK